MEYWRHYECGKSGRMDWRWFDLVEAAWLLLKVNNERLNELKALIQCLQGIVERLKADIGIKAAIL